MLSEFQNKKESVQKKLSALKKKKNLLDQLTELIKNNSMSDFEKNFRMLFKKNVDNALKAIKSIEEQESNNINLVESNYLEKNIRLHVIWVPIFLITFKASQEGRKIDGKAFYSDFDNKVFIISPTTS